MENGPEFICFVWNIDRIEQVHINNQVRAHLNIGFLTMPPGPIHAK